MNTSSNDKNAIRLSLPLTAALLATALLVGACEKEVAAPPAPRNVFAMRVADASGLSERGFPGRARAGQEVNQSFRVSGPLIELPVNVGDEAKEGDVVARIDPQNYVTNLRGLEGQLQNQQANLTRAQADLRRIESVFKEDPGATSQTAVDRARQLRDSASAGVRSLQAGVQNARDQLSYTELKAPFSGVVVETYVENYETVVARQPILRLLDPSSIEFVINVPENLIGLAPYVTEVAVAFDALEGIKVPAEISEIGREASQATRTYPVTLKMAQLEDAEILPGMAGTATVVARPPEGTSLVGMQIPLTAVFTGDDMSKSYVWIVDQTTNTLSRREVELGDLAQFGVLVTSGLESGEWIVTKGVNTLAEGEEIRILDPSQ